MRRTRIALGAAFTVLVCLALTACASDGTWFTHGTPTITLKVADGCPATVTRARDVAAADPSDTKLVPTGIAPRAGLVCAYSGQLDPSNKHLAASLDGEQAKRIASALARLSLAGPKGTVNCPADSGAFAILAFSYPHHRDVDVWWSTTGCQTIDNGRIAATQIASTSFSDFETTFGSASGLPTGPYVPAG